MTLCKRLGCYDSANHAQTRTRVGEQIYGKQGQRLHINGARVRSSGCPEEEARQVARLLGSFLGLRTDESLISSGDARRELLAIMTSPFTGAPAVLSAIPGSLRDELLRAFNEIERNFRERRWEPSELNGGKLCEIVYTILRGFVDGTYTTHASKPTNMVDACREFEKVDATRFPLRGPDSDPPRCGGAI